MSQGESHAHPLLPSVTEPTQGVSSVTLKMPGDCLGTFTAPGLPPLVSRRVWLFGGFVHLPELGGASHNPFPRCKKKQLGRNRGVEAVEAAPRWASCAWLQIRSAGDREMRSGFWVLWGALASFAAEQKAGKKSKFDGSKTTPGQLQRTGLTLKLVMLPSVHLDVYNLIVFRTKRRFSVNALCKSSQTEPRAAQRNRLQPFPFRTLFGSIPKWVWVKIQAPRGPQVLV